MSEENCRGLGLDHRWSPSWETGLSYCSKCGEPKDPEGVKKYFTDLTTVEPSEFDEEQFDSENGSKWIVAVDDDGLVSILQRPNIHYSFFDNGSGAEEVGLPFETVGTSPGVYEWTCNWVVTYDPETDFPDGGEFEVISTTPLWSLPETQP